MSRRKLPLDMAFFRHQLFKLITFRQQRDKNHISPAGRYGQKTTMLFIQRRLRVLIFTRIIACRFGLGWIFL